MAETICSGNRVGYVPLSEKLRYEIAEAIGTQMEVDILLELNLESVILVWLSFWLPVSGSLGETLVAGISQ